LYLLLNSSSVRGDYLRCNHDLQDVGSYKKLSVSVVLSVWLGFLLFPTFDRLSLRMLLVIIAASRKNDLALRFYRICYISVFARIVELIHIPRLFHQIKDVPAIARYKMPKSYKNQCAVRCHFLLMGWRTVVNQYYV
jgi:hypothetical protein